MIMYGRRLGQSRAQQRAAILAQPRCLPNLDVNITSDQAVFKGMILELSGLLHCMHAPILWSSLSEVGVEVVHTFGNVPDHFSDD